jgi:hypothetical protein
MPHAICSTIVSVHALAQTMNESQLANGCVMTGSVGHGAFLPRPNVDNKRQSVDAATQVAKWQHSYRRNPRLPGESPGNSRRNPLISFATRALAANVSVFEREGAQVLRADRIALLTPDPDFSSPCTSSFTPILLP